MAAEERILFLKLWIKMCGKITSSAAFLTIGCEISAPNQFFEV
jgi:hypothetical protein